MIFSLEKTIRALPNAYDEFSSALDAETESVLMDRLTSQHPDHTMIFITHRDKIIDYCTDVLRLA
jgi:ABC-type bacteriocin/lantibiotic exporter with double-glycine peptidase domain